MFIEQETYVNDLLFDDKTIDGLYNDIIEFDDMMDSTSERINHVY